MHKLSSCIYKYFRNLNFFQIININKLIIPLYAYNECACPFNKILHKKMYGYPSHIIMVGA